MNIELLEVAAEALGDLLDDVMFVGGATIELVANEPRHALHGPVPWLVESRPACLWAPGGSAVRAIAGS
jgi:hypothetical protein